MENSLPATILLSRDDLKEIGIHFSAPHLLRLESAGKFPRRVRLSPLRVAWIKQEVLDWIEQRAAQRAAEDNDDL
jgi:prophage regulatory protein